MSLGRLGFGANACTLCHAPAVTFGDQRVGGTRVCVRCLPLTKVWLDLDPGVRAHLSARYAALARESVLQEEIARASTIRALTRAPLGELAEVPR